ncbi:AMP-binding protein [Thalassiella azotivora]
MSAPAVGPLAPERVPFATDLDRHGDRVALVTADGEVSYRDLARRVDAVAARLGPTRRLVLLPAAADVGTVVAYLAALAGGHPVLLAPADKPAAVGALLAAYDPDVVARPDGAGVVLDERRPGSAHDLHPDLALLLSTSGSTGSPKTVRLSVENLRANTEAIAGYLGLTDADRTVTSLPLAYCYGLSVLNTHLLRGGTVALTGASVVDPCFWDLFRRVRATSLAGVPYTFELLDRVGFAAMDLPSLRYVTQAGGRLAPDAVRRYAGLGRERGWDLFVMYGQTEATARMAYLPPSLAAERPSTIGVPVPGGAFRLDPAPELSAGVPTPAGEERGELVYTGPNVMLGYAAGPDDLTLGRTVHELRTGDLARRHPDGLYEVVGRRSRFLKVVGLRVDLGRVERVLADLGLRATATGDDSRLVVAVEGADRDAPVLAALLAGEIGLPRAAVTVVLVPELPRLPNGKPDAAAVLSLAPGGAASSPDLPGTAGGSRPATVRGVLAACLDAPVDGDDTFVGLGGDSLSYVEVSVRLEEVLGTLPAGWHLTPVRELEALALATADAPAPGPLRRWRERWAAPLETSIVVRAVAIVLIVGTHAALFDWKGSAHVLMAVAGYNFARFQLSGDRWPRLRRQLRSLRRVVVPSVAFIAFAHLVTDDYSSANVLLLNALVGPETWTTQWRFWFVEVLVYVLLAVVALLAVPWADRAERRAPFAFPVGLLAVGLLARYDVVGVGVPHPMPVLWLFALGWAVARARTVPRRVLVSAVAALTVPGFFDDPVRDAIILGGVLLLAWVPALPVPRRAHRVVGYVASASLYVYLVHWLVYPPLVAVHPAVAVGASLAAGVGYWALAERAPRRVRSVLTRARDRAPGPAGQPRSRTATSATSSSGRDGSSSDSNRSHSSSTGAACDLPRLSTSRVSPSSSD